MNNIAIFASGSGTNAEQIIRYFAHSETARVTLLLSNREDAYALTRARTLGVETIVFDRSTFRESDRIPHLLAEHKIDFLVLAGFLWLLPTALVQAYSGRILNIHPSLLPAYGGKGMYGNRVHQAVIEAGEKESGITIHRVDEIYDNGAIVAQYKLKVLPDDTPETLAARIHELEYTHYPRVIEQEIRKL